MSAVRRLARPMLAASFVHSGLDAVRHPGPRAEAARPVIARVRTTAPQLNLPDDPELLVRANGAAMLVGGLLLALGRFPRLAALVLSAALVPTTLSAHRFWEAEEPEQRKQQQQQFLKSVGLLGGTLLAAVDTDGKPGLSWRARRTARDTRRTAALASREAKHAARTARREARLARHQVEDALHLG